jgi:hypothetical protein
MNSVVAGLDRTDPGRPKTRELAVDSQGRVIVVMAGDGSTGIGALVDGSGTIVVGGTAQVLFGGTVPEDGYAIYNANPDNDLWINDTGAAAAPEAAGSIRLAAGGGGYETPRGVGAAAAVSIYGAVTGMAFTARRWTRSGASALTPIDGSGTITAGGTAQPLFNSAVPASGFAIYNPDPYNDLWINDGGGNAAIAGAGSIRVPANGGGYETPTDMVPGAGVSIVGAVTGQKFTARRW